MDNESKKGDPLEGSSEPEIDPLSKLSQATPEPDGQQSVLDKIKHTVLGAPRNLRDPKVFHSISLIAFLAWVGLGADGLSSSAYGPDESFRALGTHTYLAVALALATAFTVFIISYAYSRLIEHFPSGGGGYIVASHLIGPRFGVISGSALLVDYVLTISVSIASGADQIFSVLPPEWAQWKLLVETSTIFLLLLLNLRGVKESVTILMPIFLIFLLSHAIMIFVGLFSHVPEIGRVTTEVTTGFSKGLSSLGFMVLFGIFIKAYSMGAGTYTGIEAVSNGLQIMREPKIHTARKTMLYMSLSLAITAGGILICYLLFRVSPVEGKTMNAVLSENFAGSWMIGTFPIGQVFIWIVLGSEAALLFVAAQAGFIDGPRVMANMAGDSWLPHRFTSLSDRLTMQNGVILMAGAAIVTLLITGGDVSTLVLMYSINVFATFSLTEIGMVRFWYKGRHEHHDWSKKIVIHVIGLTLCLSILVVNIIEKFLVGGWVTLVVTVALILFCFWIRKHYDDVKNNVKKLDDLLADIPLPDATTIPEMKPNAPTAVMLVGGYGGLGLHTLLSIQRLFPNSFKNVIFVSAGVIDSVRLKGAEEVEQLQKKTEEDLAQYVNLAHKLGFASEARSGVGIEVVDEVRKICLELAREYPRSIFFASKLIFEKEHWYQRLLHNETANQIQRRLQFDGLNSMILPVRIFETAAAKK
ncbi:MAG TPA: APC family permease [Candidatus Kapabacteria bacterium]|nr:APC family permease [Candidatus Kapabacteria bacterium]